MRFAMTARTVARCQSEDKPINDITAMNISKVTRYRQGGERALDAMVKKIKGLELADRTKPVKEVWGDGKDKGPIDPWLVRKHERLDEYRKNAPLGQEDLMGRRG